jgi:hypothetical protein
MCSRSENDSDDSPQNDFDADSETAFENHVKKDFEDDCEEDYEDISQENHEYKIWARTVTVYAGSDKVPFKLHTAPLVEKSPYFRKALQSRVLGCVKQLLCLVTIPALYFMMYTHWVYTSQLDFAALGYRQNGDDFVTYRAVQADGSDIEMYSNVDRHLEKTSDWAHHLIVLWVHAEFLGDVRLQNTISEELERWWFDENLVVSIHGRSYAFVGKHTSPDSPLRKLCIDWADRSLVFRSWERRPIEVEKLPKWLSTQLLLMKMRRERGTLKDDPRKMNPREVDPREMDPKRLGRYHVRCNGC